MGSAGFDLDPLPSSTVYHLRALLRELPKRYEPSSALPWSHRSDKERLWWTDGVLLKESGRVQASKRGPLQLTTRSSQALFTLAQNPSFSLSRAASITSGRQICPPPNTDAVA
jgi:hypothetical protein